MNRQGSGFLATHNFSLETVLDNEDLRQCFAGYLKKYKIDDMYNLLMEINQFSKYVGTSARYNAAKKFASTHLNGPVFSSLENSDQLAEQAMNELNKSSEQQCARSMFDDIRNAVHVALSGQPFTNFLTSKTFERFLSDKIKKDKNYLDTIAERKQEVQAPPEQATQATDRKPGIPYDQSILEITDFDFKYHLADYKDNSLWDLVDKGSRSSLYTSKALFYNKDRGIKKVKEVYKIRFPIDVVFHVLFSRKYEHLFPATSYDHLSELDGGAYRSEVLRVVMKMPFPYKTRDYISLATAKTLQDGSIFVVTKSVDDPNHPPTRNYVRCLSYGSFILERRLKLDQTILTKINWTDTLMNSLTLGAVKKNDSSFVANVEEACYDWTIDSDKNKYEHPLNRCITSNNVVSGE
ncbi:STARD7 [Acrasis kona]|uniref:STARD7 n=1 Tax=Acrasis kona TaxID=1008807 RepID=A0AAW2ZDX1_9EUKA